MTRSDDDGSNGRINDRAISSGLWVLGGTWIQALLRLAVLTVLARLLGPADFGVARTPRIRSPPGDYTDRCGEELADT